MQVDNDDNYISDNEEYNEGILYNSLPWIEKYRPSSLDQILSHDEIISTLKTFVTNKCLPHLLFYGPPGNGKTSTIMAVANELYGKYCEFMVMELNASDDRGIEVVRTKIKQFVTAKNTFFGGSQQTRQNIFKLVILDETDAMTNDAQAILRKIVEEYTKNTRFCLICNNIKNISPALQSRCTRFRFSPISISDARTKIMNVVKQENITIDKSGVDTVIKRSKGDMRKVINNLQAVSMITSKITEKHINDCIGYPGKKDMEHILANLLEKPFGQCYKNILQIKNKCGFSLSDIITEIHDILLEYIIEGTTKYTVISNLSLDYMTNVIDMLRVIEYNISVSTTENTQLGGIIAIFKKIDNV